MKTKQITFRGYFHEAKNKSQVYLHHTAGNDNAQSVYSWWESQGKKIATCVVINSKGEIIQGFGSEYWGYHLVDANLAQCHRGGHCRGCGTGAGLGGEQALEEFESQAIERQATLFEQRHSLCWCSALIRGV